MKTSREAFEAWYGSKPEQTEDGNYAGAFTQARWETWQACDAHWREKLQSEEMAENVAKAIFRYLDITKHWEIFKDEAKVAIAAISKEMGV